MIVRQFLSWVRTAPAGERAEATRALARAYLISDLSEDDRIAAEGALLMLLDDASSGVRRAMADVFARSADAPPAIVHALASDEPAVAAPILEHSPLVLDADLVDIVATAQTELQSAIARREMLCAPVCAAIAEVGSAQACLDMLRNPDAEIAAFSLDRLAERHGHLAPIREVLVSRNDLPAPTRLVLAEKLSGELSQFAGHWLDDKRAERLRADMRERACINVAASASGADLAALVVHLRENGRLTAGLILRGLLSGNRSLFEHAMSDLAGMPVSRVSSLLSDRRGSAIGALMSRAGLPASTFPAFREAVAAMDEVGSGDGAEGVARLRRRMVDRVLARCMASGDQAAEPLLLLLRRFATEAAREEARLFCDELVAEQDGIIALDDNAIALHASLAEDEIQQDDIVYQDEAPLQDEVLIQDEALLQDESFEQNLQDDTSAELHEGWQRELLEKLQSSLQDNVPVRDDLQDDLQDDLRGGLEGELLDAAGKSQASHQGPSQDRPRRGRLAA